LIDKKVTDAVQDMDDAYNPPADSTAVSVFDTFIHEWKEHHEKIRIHMVNNERIYLDKYCDNESHYFDDLSDWRDTVLIDQPETLGKIYEHVPVVVWIKFLEKKEKTPHSIHHILKSHPLLR
jgi:hypothetical protein